MSVLCTAAELRDALSRPGTVAVDTRPATDWRKATIPDAICLNVYDYFVPESTEAGYAAMAAGAWEAFREAGLLDCDRMVWFEEHTGMRSPRGLWFQELLGLPDGAILDGGLASWTESGGETAPGQGSPVEISHRSDLSPPEGWQPGLAATTEEVLHPGHGRDILDVRRRTEFEGTFRHDCCARSGRIPASAFLFYEDMLENGRYLDPAEIRARAEAAGLRPEREIVTYCHRGARAATALYGLRLAGFENLRVYVGSWHEWAGRPELPLESGAA